MNKEQGEKVYDSMEDVLTQVNDPIIVLETIISRETYLKTKRPEKPSDETSSRKQLKSTNLKSPGSHTILTAISP